MATKNIMKVHRVHIKWLLFILPALISKAGYAILTDTIPPRHRVTLREAHVGDLETDTRLLDSYVLLPDNVREFYLQARAVFANNPDADFTDHRILAAAKSSNLALMGGPLLGNLSDDGVIVWLRPATSVPLEIKVRKTGGRGEKSYPKTNIEAGVVQRIELDGLSSGTEYTYVVYAGDQPVAEGNFSTAPAADQRGSFKLVFGSCFHKIGLHNPNLANEITKQKPQAVMLLGDIAVDDRENRIAMHRSDYLLRDVSKPWQQLAASFPLYACWDDHDYLNNDLSGIPSHFTADDREALRAVWQQNWNNPENPGEGIYFNTRTGPVEIIMLDTRSCRANKRRGQYGSYLGSEQLNWLKQTLKNSKAPFKVVSSGTMWSDYISNGKDSWGTWDTKAREELFSFIEKEGISGVLFISGDRHGARGFALPRPSGFAFYEFEAGSLGGVPGPDAMAKNATSQLFGYQGTDAIAFGEFTFNTAGNAPRVRFRLIDQQGRVLEEKQLSYSELTPRSK